MNKDKIDYFKSLLTQIENGEISNELICYCGHDCSKCLVFRATLADDNDMREASKKFYETNLGREITIEKINCLSGRSDEIMELCRECPFIKCCGDKNLHGCSDCAEYPCPTLEWYTEKYVNKFNQI
ncbi:MAG: DUF3795 domain-containing protein [Oscillospiraceae bacterium]|nr:DUF3795 domain-containing protein [Oscillospiraceae bacterium]